MISVKDIFVYCLKKMMAIKHFISDIVEAGA
jgi:hypothetical protein